ncbi:unnamed protein product [Ostreobium quekettii]|uniref:Uncharacterized protein n=1 Tax=Ostreobium quekettii TaxID=121088 RepID=A0A8S1ILY1_9CHLO|nr:unnamed protein product [Ostreobium quekettii]
MWSLSRSWGWSKEDCILHALPLHHIHGIVNALHCAHFNGARVDFLSPFSPQKIWKRLQEGDVTLFMGVPTMYAHLLSWYDSVSSSEQASMREAASGLRLFVCGSAACPAPVMKRWQDVTGHRLLERYGMTELGMALSNPLKGERRQNSVGIPLPGVDVKIVESPTQQGITSSVETPLAGSHKPTRPGDPSLHVPRGPGELRVRGETLFKEYWGMPDETNAAFDDNGYFKTGDTAVLEGAPPYYRILGRTNVDIIKSGGYTISALEIESCILEHPAVAECAVVGLPDEIHGQVVAAVAACSDGSSLSLDDLREFCKDILAAYKMPQRLRVVSSIQRNAMGKVNKMDLVKLFPDGV